MRYIYFVVLLTVMLFSCKGNGADGDSKNQDATKPEVKTNTQKPIAKEGVAINYPSLTEGVIRNLGMKCDYVDYIFYDLPISISQDNKKAIISNINFISQEVPTNIPIACKPMGRKFFHVQGDIILEADIYLNKEEGCYFYVFYENGKKAYANKIAADGVKFYFNVFDQAGINK